MCGRFSQMMSWEELAELLGMQEAANHDVELKPRYNIAPTHPVIVARGTDEMVIDRMPWGFKPESSKRILINARSEKYLSPKTRLWKQWQRCVVPASGFYEWQRKGAQKIPTYITAMDRRMLLGGLHQAFVQRSGEVVDFVVVMTTRPNTLMEPIHHRMPVLLRREDLKLWLSPECPPNELQRMAQPFDSALMETWPVSDRVNSVVNDDPDCVERVEEPKPAQMELL